MEKRELSDIGFALLRKLIASAGAKQAVEIAATAGIFTYAYIACSKQMMDPAGKNEINFLNILICKLAKDVVVVDFFYFKPDILSIE